jgi:hypothetical protein
MIEEKRAITDEELSIFPIYVYLVSGDEKRGEIGVFTDISNLATNSAMLDQEVLVEEASF